MQQLGQIQDAADSQQGAIHSRQRFFALSSLPYRLVSAIVQLGIFDTHRDLLHHGFQGENVFSTECVRAHTGKRE